MYVDCGFGFVMMVGCGNFRAWLFFEMMKTSANTGVVSWRCLYENWKRNSPGLGELMSFS